MAMPDSPIVGGVAWLAIILICGFVYWRLKTRRRHIGSAGAGTVYDMISEEKRNAVEIVVEDKAAARDFEHADDDDEPGSGSRHQSNDNVRSYRETQS
jgi:hypothetical protein